MAMYDDNPTLTNLDRTIDERKQEKCFFAKAKLVKKNSTLRATVSNDFSDSEIVASILSDVVLPLLAIWRNRI